MSILHKAMNILAVVPDDVRKRLNPKNVPHGFLGADSTVPLADVIESLEEQVDTVVSRVPAIYGGLTERIEGEELIRSALGGEGTVQLGLFPVANVRVYVNLDRPWSVRRASDSLRDGVGCVVNAETGLVTLEETLDEDDIVVAEYDHGAMAKCYLLRRIAVDLTAAEWARRLYPDDQKFDRYAEWEKRAWFDLARMRRKDEERMGIRMFDRLKLIEETQEERMVGGGELDSSGDMM